MVISLKAAARSRSTRLLFPSPQQIPAKFRRMLGNAERERAEEAALAAAIAAALEIRRAAVYLSVVPFRFRPTKSVPC
ncbi:hypothetical protein [Aureimonas sp. SK2]|uniref:hypothetical protein n=1 Tax=Aureimonas sp. SK2 TaxID=3015992 RepID=UPI002443992A|nr:hypothetical protein [Aureimonas sp. SK2]